MTISSAFEENCVNLDEFLSINIEIIPILPILYSSSLYSLYCGIISVVCYDHLDLALSAQEVLNVIMGCSNGTKTFSSRELMLLSTFGSI